MNLINLAPIVILVAACSATNVRPAAYSAELAECTRVSSTCDESIACENRVRVRYGRPLRTGGCQ